MVRLPPHAAASWGADGHGRCGAAVLAFGGGATRQERSSSLAESRATSSLLTYRAFHDAHLAISYHDGSGPSGWGAQGWSSSWDQMISYIRCAPLPVQAPQVESGPARWGRCPPPPLQLGRRGGGAPPPSPAGGRHGCALHPPPPPSFVSCRRPLGAAGGA